MAIKKHFTCALSSAVQRIGIDIVGGEREIQGSGPFWDG